MSMRKAALLTMIALFAAAIAVGIVRVKMEEAENKAKAEYVPTVQTVTITAAGDCTFATDVNADPDRGFNAYADSLGGDYSYFLQNVKPVFEEDDVTIVNFEGTISDRGERADKTFAFRGKPEYVKVLTTSSVEAANLANNHSADYGEESLSDTIKYLNEAGIINCIGTNAPVQEINGIKVGFVGIDALDEDEAAKIDKAIGSVKNLGAQLIIVSMHWGIEKENEPTQEQIELAHKAVDLGADVVLGTHPHVLQGIEKYNGKYIVYSLGNFCFGGNDNPSDKDTMIYRQVFTFVDGVLRLDDNYVVIPAVISGHDDYNDYQPAIADGDRKTEIQNRITEYSASLGTQSVQFR